MKLDDALHGVSRLAFDTAPIIYFVEAHPTYDGLVSNIFNRVAAGELEGWTSVVSLSEVLVQPFVSGRSDLQAVYRDLLLKGSNFHTPDKRDSRGKRRANARRVRSSLAGRNPGCFRP